MSDWYEVGAFRARALMWVVGTFRMRNGISEDDAQVMRYFGTEGRARHPSIAIDIPRRSPHKPSHHHHLASSL